MRNNVLSFASALLLTACYAGPVDKPNMNAPAEWQNALGEAEAPENLEVLQSWWEGFEDPVLDDLIAKALADNPDRRAAQARVLEARGIRRTARGGLFPNIGASASAGREAGLFSSADDFFDARFDASFEIGIFGRNKKIFARDSLLAAQEAAYEDVSLSLAAETARSYIELRAAQKQVEIAQNNLQVQEKTLELIRALEAVGENPQLDVERAEGLVNATRAAVPEFERQAENARLQLTVLTGSMPEELRDLSTDDPQIPGGDVRPVMMIPAKVLALRPDVRAAAANLQAQTQLADAAAADVFPKLTLSGFYGVAESGFASMTSIWNVALGAAVTVLDFGRIAGQIDAARAREKEAYELYRGAVLEAVRDVETALNDYAKLHERAVLLGRSYKNAQAAFSYAETLFKEGEISFLDVLDAQRTLNQAQSDFTAAQGQEVSALVRLYKSLGVGPVEE